MKTSPWTIGADRYEGWRNHYMRLMRWKARATENLSDLPRRDFHDALDFSLAYFVWCHSLREWLIKDGALAQVVLDDELSRYPIWRVCRDLANRSRHLVITQNPTDAEWAVFREYDPLSLEIEGIERHHMNLFFGGNKHRLADVVNRTDQMWSEILSRQGLI